MGSCILGRKHVFLVINSLKQITRNGSDDTYQNQIQGMYNGNGLPIPPFTKKNIRSQFVRMCVIRIEVIYRSLFVYSIVLNCEIVEKLVLKLRKKTGFTMTKQKPLHRILRAM